MEKLRAEDDDAKKDDLCILFLKTIPKEQETKHMQHI